MRKLFAIAPCILVLLVSLVSIAPAKTVPGKRYHVKELPQVSPPPVDFNGGPSLSAAAADTFNLGWWDFDSGGVADPQGWTTVDLTTQPFFWHVASNTPLTGELDGGTFGNLLPLEGIKSMWCGQAASTSALYCGWATLPGYGNSWKQVLRSTTLPGDSVRISYKVFWDSVTGYDGTSVEYSGDGGTTWIRFPLGDGPVGMPDVYDGGPETAVAAFSVGGLTTVDLRYRFRSDGAWSDEDGLWPTDGGTLLDSITVTTWAGGIQASTNFEDFEGAADGDTLVGIWCATTSPVFGNFAALFPGVTILQEDPCFTNFSHLWGFFDDPSSTNYNCHVPDPRPDVGAMRFGGAATNGLYMTNEIWSPFIDNIGAGNEYRLEFLTYRDLPLDNLQFYVWTAKNIDASGCPGSWNNNGFVFFGGQKDWLRTSFQVGVHISPTAPQIQLSIGVVDACGFWCNVFGSGACHSHAPLFDEVHLKRINVIGPQFVVRHIDLFQDNFSENGTLTGTSRADAANDILPTTNGAIMPGDSVTMDIVGLGANVLLGAGGPAAYCYVAVQPQGQPGKTGTDIEAPETRLATGGGPFGKRWPLVASPVIAGLQWYQFRMDSAFTSQGAVLADRFSIDLNDNVFTPGDTINYFFGAEGGGNPTFFHRTLKGQGANRVTSVITEAATDPMEFMILPAAGTLPGNDILYVDDSDDRGGPAQLFWDTVFQQMGLLDDIDRYDVLGPSSVVANSLASRVKNVATQIIGPYRLIFWNSGNLSSGLMGDGGTNNGGGGAEKSDDFALLFQFLDTHPNHPGFYYSADDAASDWALTLTGTAAVNTRSTYMNFNLDPAAPGGDHKNAGEPISPILDGVGTIGIGEQLVAYGGCPSINDFDLLTPIGLSVAEYSNVATGKTYVLSQSTPNSNASSARVVLSGFSFHYVRNTGAPTGVLARSIHLRNIFVYTATLPPVPVGIDPIRYANILKPNYPNPFNPTTTIGYEIKDQGHVSLKIYNAAGRLVRTLVNEVQTPQPGGFSVTWDGTNNAGQGVSSGVYFYKLAAKGFTQTKKMVLLK